jgi:hypothetical protein
VSRTCPSQRPSEENPPRREIELQVADVLPAQAEIGSQVHRARSMLRQRCVDSRSLARLFLLDRRGQRPESIASRGRSLRRLVGQGHGPFSLRHAACPRTQRSAGPIAEGEAPFDRRSDEANLPAHCVGTEQGPAVRKRAQHPRAPGWIRSSLVRGDRASRVVRAQNHSRASCCSVHR